MIEKTLKTTDGKLRVKIPSRLNEVTLGQLMQMQDVPNLTDLDAISILSEVPVSELKNVLNIQDFDVFGEVIFDLSNQIKHLYSIEDIPAKATFDIDVKKISVKVIRNLSVEPTGAFMAAREIIADEISEHIKLYGEEDWQERFNPSLKACCQVLAQYFYCRVTGKKYNEYEAEAFSETVKKMIVTEALPIGKHFFMSYPNLSKPKVNYYQRFRQFWRKRPAYSPSRSLNI
ncbi:MAG: hypothetical protein JWR50_3470 [Mucilaginibacter sp.]|nr:hypothetical protein [Mucilaginibacter sp.]